MRRTVGWRDVLPWSVGLLGLFVLAQFVIAWAIEAEVVRCGERRVGARVEVGDTRVSLVGSRVSLRNISVANPQSPLRNLVEADRCDLQLEPGASAPQAGRSSATASSPASASARPATPAARCPAHEFVGDEPFARAGSTKPRPKRRTTGSTASTRSSTAISSISSNRSA